MLAICLNETAVSSAEKSAYKLPKNPKAVVISFDWAGGFTPPRKSNAPVLSILRDGTVNMPDRFGLSKDVTGKISQRELQELLAFAIKTNKFFEYDPAKVKKKIEIESKKRPFIPRIADAPSSVIFIQIAGKSHKVSHYALAFAASQFKTIKELQQLYAIEKRLRRLMDVTRLGGPTGVKAMLTLANAELKKKYPKVKPLTMEDLQSTGIDRNGSKRVSFHRSGKTATGKPDGTFVNVFIQMQEEGNPKVTVRAKLK